jgi:hypothetical protein
LDLLDGDLQLVRDPGVGASLADPSTDPIELGAKRSTGHEGPESSTGRGQPSP